MGGAYGFALDRVAHDRRDDILSRMPTRGLAGWVVVMVGMVAAFGAGSARAADSYCTGSYGGAAPRVGTPLRFGVDPGLAGSVGGVQTPSVPDDLAKDVAAASALRPPGHVLVARLNRLFWSDGDAGLAQFQRLVSRYTAAGLDVELQVRYHPTSTENGDLTAWEAYVRHVVDVFGANPHVVAMTITNEVNVTFSPNTSDGSYTNAPQALIDGIEAAHTEAVRRGFDQLRFGFTFAYRFSPPSDAAFFQYLAAHGGAAFRAALGFVGLDFYPGSVYPPAMAPGDTYRAEMAQALGTVRDCYTPMALVGASVPIWITENGIPTGADVSDAQQAAALVQLVQAAKDYSGTFNVTDYRWFNLRDTESSPVGSAPGAAATFATDGLLDDNYTPKPAFAAYRNEIAQLGRLEPAATAPRAGCPQPTGRLVGRTLGRLTLGMTRARARRTLSRYSTRHRRFMDFFCLHGGAIRAAYPSPSLLHGLRPRQRRSITGRIVLLLTANSHYALSRVTPGMRVARALRRLGARRAHGIRVGLNTWYVLGDGSSRGVLRAQRGTVREIGIATGRLVATRRAARRMFVSLA